MTKLIVEPIKKVARVARFLKTIGVRLYPTLIVIDGLDEIEGEDVQIDIIRIIGNAMKDVRLPLRFLIASRPEPHICKAINKLRSQFPQDRVSTIDLKEDALARRDIQRYFNVKFQEVRDMHPELPGDWPGTDIVMQLVDKASGQFIYATTIISYIMSPYYSSDDRLAIIRGLMEKPPGDTPFHNLDELYSYIVRKANRRETIFQIMGLLIIINNLSSSLNIDLSNSAAQLCSPQKIDQILGFKRGEVRRCLTDMHSLLDVGEDDRNIRIYHKSFPDFLLDESRSHKFYINLTDQDYDRIYSLIICASKHQEIILEILGQVIIAEGMPSEVDIFETPQNSRSPKRTKMILGVEHSIFKQLMADMHLLLEFGNDDEDLTIRHPSFLAFLLDGSRSQNLFIDVDYAHLTFRFSSQIQTVFNAAALSKVLVGMRSNKESIPQLQDISISDWVYSRFVSNHEHQDIILQIFGQVMVAHSMPSDVDMFGTPANSSSPNRIEDILGLKRGIIIQAFADLYLTREPLHKDQNIKIWHPSFLDFLLERSRSQNLFVDMDYAHWIFQFSSRIRSVFTAPVFSKIMAAMRNDKESIPLLQDDSIFDWAYPRLVSSSKYRDDILQILGQVIVANSMPSDVDIFGTPANSSSPRRIEQILGLENGTVVRAFADVHLTQEPLDEDQNIRIRHLLFLKFLQDKSRSQDIFVDINNAKHTLRIAPIRWIFDREVLDKAFGDMHGATFSISQCVKTAIGRCNAAGLLQDLSEVLPNFIWVRYMSFMRLAPWKRHPATDILKKVCAVLTECGFPGFHESDISPSVEGYWDGYTWKVSNGRPTSSPVLLISVFAQSSAIIRKFMASLSNHRASLLLAEDQYVLFKGPASTQGETAILFRLMTEFTSVKENTVALHFFDERRRHQRFEEVMPHIHGPGRAGEAQAWEWLYSVCYKCGWLS